MTPEERKADFDAVAAERASTLDKVSVIDGSQPYHADALHPDEHVAGNVLKEDDFPLADETVEPDPIGEISEQEHTDGE